MALAVESAQDLRIELSDPGRVQGQIVAPRAALPAGLRVALVPTLLRPSALYPAAETPVDATGRFEAVGGVGEHEVVVSGLPRDWVVRRAAPVWLTTGGTLTDVKVEIGPR